MFAVPTEKFDQRLFWLGQKVEIVPAKSAESLLVISTERIN